MMYFVNFTFLDKDDREHKLLYHLNDSNLVQRWIKILDKNTARDENFIHSCFMNHTYDNLPVILTEFNEIVFEINKRYDRQLPNFDSTDILDQKILNDLHEEFEYYGDRIEKFEEENLIFADLHLKFLRLNELIHTCEQIMNQRTDGITSMAALFDYWPQEIHEKIHERDKIYLTHHFEWGGLYLGYNTLGKDWLEICNDMDIEVIARDQVNPQQRFAAESWLYFSSDCINFNNAVRFEKLYESLEENLKQKVPIDNLNDLTFGRFQIGYLVITDYFLRYHNNKSDWRSKNHPIKNKWNKEVFSTFKKIIKAEIHAKK